MMNREKMIAKIQNLLDLASNNPEEHEAIAAALKAQELMAKYDIELTDVQDSDVADQEIVDEILSFEKNSGYCIKWRFQLSSLIAKNFKVKNFCVGNDKVGFYGYKSDVQVAVSVFKYLFSCGNKLSCKYYYKCKKEGRTTRGVMNSYLLGFMKGLKDVLEKQCTELMIVTPKEVSDAFEEMTANWRVKSAKISNSGDVQAYDDGRVEGRNIVEARSLEVAS